MLFIMKPSRKDVMRRLLRNVQGGNRGVKEPFLPENSDQKIKGRKLREGRGASTLPSVSTQ